MMQYYTNCKIISSIINHAISVTLGRETSHASIYRQKKKDNNNFTADTDGMLLLLFLFKQIIILCSSAYKRYSFVTVNL